MRTKPKIRLSATNIEQVRRYYSGDWPTTEDLIAHFQRVFKPNRMMELGSAFHEALERPSEHRIVMAKRQKKNVLGEMETIAMTPIMLVGAYRFRKEDVDKALAILPRSRHENLWEAKKVKVYETSRYDVEVVAKIDLIHGKHIYDHKTKWSQFDIDSYLDSMQWRVYLDVWQADQFTYNVFMMKDTLPKQNEDEPPVQIDWQDDEVDAIMVAPPHQFTCLPYDGMTRDWMRWVEAAIDFIEQHDLLEYVQPKGEEEYEL